MSENLIDALMQLAVSALAIFWWWRAEYWKRKAESDVKAEREACADLCFAKATENADKWEGDEAKAASWMMLQCSAAIKARSNAPGKPPAANEPNEGKT